MPRGRPDLRNHGAAYGRSWWRPAGYALLGHARRVTAQRDGPDVPADERLPFGTLAEADLAPAKRSPPVVIRLRSKKFPARVAFRPSPSSSAEQSSNGDME